MFYDVVEWEPDLPLLDAVDLCIEHLCSVCHFFQVKLFLVLLLTGRTEHTAAAEETLGAGTDHRGLRRDRRPAVTAVSPTAGDGPSRLVSV